MKKLVITIDGPAGSGKTTVSKKVAEKLNYTYVDTGALYRGVAFEMAEKGVDVEDEQALSQALENIHLSFRQVGEERRLFSEDRDISGDIRTPEISMMASRVSAKPLVRKFLLGLQRRLGEEKCAVFEGRDMGTVVFPEADIKFFMTASIEERAKRRYLELRGKSSQTLEEVLSDMKTRDENDSTRAIAPLKPANDAIHIDTTSLSIDEIISEMLMTVRKQQREVI